MKGNVRERPQSPRERVLTWDMVRKANRHRAEIQEIPAGLERQFKVAEIGDGRAGN
jgi:hypothetical protein